MGARRSVRTAVCVLTTVALSIAAGAPASAKPRPPAPDRTPPSQPTDLHVTAVTQTSVTLAWSPSTDNVGVRSYSLWHEGLNGFNASTPSDPVTVTTLHDTTAPSAPSGLTVSTVTASKVLLTWNSGTDQFNPVRHEILVNGVPTANAFSTVPAGTNPRPPVQSAWVRQLDPSTSYDFKVRAVDPSGNVSAPSNTEAATTQASNDADAPTSPTLLSAFDGGNSSCPEELWLSWTASTDGAESASAIEYEVRVNGTIIDVIPGGTQTVSYTEVLGANTVTIVAVDRAGNASAPSNPLTVFTNWAPGGCGL